ncbi:MlaD family protein [Vibrio zhugei]|uniref:MlaD family protein n=1 Tax=Vibrio zhugei TaxID=2479546 RepID=A0ABV7CBV5_9VIBR|nr:MlaD family protein [Vibrio zhugei]
MNNNSKSYEPEIKRSRGISPLWILPILTMVLAGWLVYKAINDAGVRVQIHFSNGQGLVAGRTTIRYQGLEVGMVRNIKLSPDLESIFVDAEIYPEAIKLLSKDTQFWLVKPKASLSGVSGLDALVSGNYIAIQPGETETNNHPDEYQALDSAPANQIAHHGMSVQLNASNLGGLSVGSQIVYKKIPIGEVLSYQLDKNNKSVLIQASIKEDYKDVITNKSRFWNVSGIGANMGFNGIDVHLESLSALIGGAIAVDSPDGGEPVKEHAQFHLYKNLKTAGRGIPITITLPDNSQVNPDGSPIMYRGIEIGQITDLNFNDDRSHVVASAAVEPAFSDLLTSGTQFLLEEPELSVSGSKNLTNFVKGNFLTLIPSEHKASDKTVRQFVAKRQAAFDKRHAMSLTLWAPDSYGLETGTPIYYRGITVGRVVDVQLQKDKVAFSITIDDKYRHLVRSQNRFYLSSSARAQLSDDGVSVSIPPAKRLLTGSISFMSAGQKHAAKHYQLYENQSLANLAQVNQSGSQALTLVADKLPPISTGSPLLYRNLKVGTVTQYHLTDADVEVTVNIENQYRHLLTENTVFWNHSGIDIQASLSGISMQAAPLQSLLKGGIEFDNFKGIDNRVNDHWKLYPDYDQARHHGTEVTLVTEDNPDLKVGTPLQYKGVNVGKVISIAPDFAHHNVTIKAQIQPDYSQQLARAGSVFWVSKVKISLKGIDNIDKLFHNSISVEPGNGAATTEFSLSKSPYKAMGTTFVLQSASRQSVMVGTPVLYRGLEVGHVKKVALSSLADRIVSTIEIKPQYAYLVRQNTVFWNTSGVDVSIGISGASVKSGTLDSLIRGGISFATPDKQPLLHAAKEGQSFILHQSAEEDWKEWSTVIPKP